MSLIHDNVADLANWLGMDVYGEVWAVLLAVIGYFAVSHINRLNERQAHLYKLISEGFNRDTTTTTFQLKEIKTLINKIPSIYDMNSTLCNALDVFNNIVSNMKDHNQTDLCNAYELVLLSLSKQSYLLPFSNKYKHAYTLRSVKPYLPKGAIELDRSIEILINGLSQQAGQNLVDHEYKELIQFLCTKGNPLLPKVKTYVDSLVNEK